MKADTYLLEFLLFLSIPFLISGSSIIIICEDELGYLRCPAPESIQILSASYGRTENSTVCPTDPQLIKDLNCAAPKAFEEVVIRCNGKSQCSLEASNRVFGDPCVGTYKYLYMEYVCEDNTI